MIEIEKLLWKTTHKHKFKHDVDFLETILTQLGIDNIKAFLNVSPLHCHDPFLLNNMQNGIELLYNNLDKTIFIKVDSDTDGYTSATYMRKFIELISPNTKIIYGFNFNKEHGIYYNEIKDREDNEDIGLIIVPDAGSDSINDCKQIKEKLKIPILIIDHHGINEKIHNYATLINCTDGNYPNPTLSGVGVVHKFCLAYCENYKINKETCNKFLDLVSLGMIADSMDLRNLETRYYVLEGLKEENRRNLFLKELAEKNADDMKLGHTIHNYGWTLAPKLNGVTRYGKEQEQIDLYRAMCEEQENIEYQPRRKSKNEPKPPIEIHSLQKTMARVCGNIKARQDTEVRKFMKEIDEQIVNNKLDNNSVIIVNGSDIFHTSNVSGLVANKIKEKYKRPVIILKNYTEELFGGSARGYEKSKITNFNEFLTNTKLFEKCQGHPNAFGINLKKENVQKVIDKCNELIKLSDLVTIHEVDYEINARELNNNMIESVAKAYSIWGNTVTEPTFVITDIDISAKDIIGYGENNSFIKFKYNGIDYVKMYCKKTDFDDITVKNRNSLGSKRNLKINIIGTFSFNEYEGKRYPQVKIKYFDSYERIEEKLNKITIDDDFIF